MIGQLCQLCKGTRYNAEVDGLSMDVDIPFGSKNGSNLKRCNSAPMINIQTLTNREENLLGLQPLFEPQPRARRFSSGGLGLATSPSSPCHLKTPSRISQIKQEEGMDVANREAAHEREVRSALQMSQSCEDLTLISLDENFGGDASKRLRCFTEPLHIFPSTYPLSSSPSPTRLGKQCFSPSMQQPVRNTTFCTSPVPSPTRKSVTRRSLSPIAVRPSLFPVKRKYDGGEKMDCYSSPQKRFHGNAFAVDRTLSAHPLANSLSFGSLDDSPDQAVPISTANTPESTCSSGGSPCSGTFKPADHDAAMQDSSGSPTPMSEGVRQENGV